MQTRTPCPKCERQIAVTAKGRIREHTRRVDSRTSIVCEGSRAAAPLFAALTSDEADILQRKLYNASLAARFIGDYSLEVEILDTRQAVYARGREV